MPPRELVRYLCATAAHEREGSVPLAPSAPHRVVSVDLQRRASLVNAHNAEGPTPFRVPGLPRRWLGSDAERSEAPGYYGAAERRSPLATTDRAVVRPVSVSALVVEVVAAHPLVVVAPRVGPLCVPGSPGSLAIADVAGWSRLPLRSGAVLSVAFAHHGCGFMVAPRKDQPITRAHASQLLSHRHAPAPWPPAPLPRLRRAPP